MQKQVSMGFPYSPNNNAMTYKKILKTVEPMWRQIVLETNVLGYGIIDMDAFLHGETFVERAITFHAPPPEPHPPVLDKKTLEKLPAVGSTKIKVALNGSKKDKLQTIMALSSEDITQE